MSLFHRNDEEDSPKKSQIKSLDRPPQESRESLILKYSIETRKIDMD